MIDASSARSGLRFESPKRLRALDTECAIEMKPRNLSLVRAERLGLLEDVYGEIHSLSQQVSLLNLEQGLAWVCLFQILPEFSDKLAILQSFTGIFIYVVNN